MSEYQYYEFLAIDRPLDDAAQAAVRSLSTRATITATSFVNEYHWGDFRGDPNALMERFYDAHLYVTNWGTHRLMLRLPRILLDPDVVDDYCVGDQVSAWVAGEFVVLDLISEDEGHEFEFDYDAETLLSGIAGVRAELAAGDLRPLYLAWLSAYGAWERDEDVFDRDADDDLEPPVPPGLGALTAAQRALADFLRLDEHLIAIAAQASAPLEEPSSDASDLGFRDETAPATPAPARRTVADLLDNAARRRADHERRLAARQAEEEARRQRERRAARDRRLDDLAAEGESAWSRVDAMIATRKPAEYDAAVTLLTDLRELAVRENHYDTFTSRTIKLRHTCERLPSLIRRLDRAGL